MDTSQADGGTRSGLLWEVERILCELDYEHRPNILVMENVPQIHSEKDYPNFERWMLKLEELGYCNFYTDLNAKDYGIPQNRERTFMVSIKGEGINYKFPAPFRRELNLNDMLEKETDEKYFVSKKMVDYLTGVNQKDSKYDRGTRFAAQLKMTNEDNIAGCITTNAGQRPTDNFIIIRENNSEGYKLAREMRDGINISSRMHHQRGNVQTDLSQTLKTSCEVGVMVYKDEAVRIRKLTPTEAGRLMGFQDIDTKHMYEVNLADASIFHMYGDAIVTTTLIGIFAKLFNLSNSETENAIKTYIRSIKNEN